MVIGDSAGFAGWQGRPVGICYQSRRAIWIQAEREYGEVKEDAYASSIIDREARWTRIRGRTRVNSSWNLASCDIPICNDKQRYW